MNWCLCYFDLSVFSMSQLQFVFLFSIGFATKSAHWKTWSPIYNIFLPFQFIPVARGDIWDSKITRKFDWINFLWHHAMDYHSKSHIASRNIFSFPFRSDQHWTLESYLSFWRAYRYQRRTRSKLCRQRWQRTIIHFKEKNLKAIPPIDTVWLFIYLKI